MVSRLPSCGLSCSKRSVLSIRCSLRKCAAISLHRIARIQKGHDNCQDQVLCCLNGTEGSSCRDFSEGKTSSIQELSLSCGDILGQHVSTLIGEVIVRLIDAWAWYISSFIVKGVLDLLNLRDLGGLKTLAFEFLWLLRWYWPSGLCSMAS